MIRRSRRSTIITLMVALAALVPAASSFAQDRMALSRACEIAVARSALPQRLRADSTVYGLADGSYQKLAEGTGPFTCVVERNHRDSIIPQCMDKAGVDSVLPAILDRSRMAVSGADFTTIETENAKRLEAGHYHPAARPGVNYMMSDYNYIYVGSAERVLKVPPHVMFYAPGLTNADIGGSFQGMIGNVGTPSTFQEGLHGYMLTYTEHRADPGEVAEACQGQLGEAPPPFDPLPKG